MMKADMRSIESWVLRGWNAGECSLCELRRCGNDIVKSEEEKIGKSVWKLEKSMCWPHTIYFHNWWLVIIHGECNCQMKTYPAITFLNAQEYETKLYNYGKLKGN